MFGSVQIGPKIGHSPLRRVPVGKGSRSKRSLGYTSYAIRASSGGDLGDRFKAALRCRSLDQAKDLATQILNQTSTHHGPESLEMARELIALGIEYAEERVWKEALPLNQKSYAFRKNHLGEGNPLTLDALCELVLVMFNLGQFRELEVLAKEGIRVSDEAYPSRYQLFNIYGLACRELGDFSKARENLEAALELLRELDEPERFTRILLDLAITEFRSGNFPGVWTQLEAVDRSLGEVPEPKKEMLRASTLEIRGSLLGMQGRYDEAEQVFNKLVTLRRKNLGDRDSQVGHALNNLGHVKMKRGDLRGAQTIIFEAISIARECGEHTIVLVQMYLNVSEISRGLGDLDLAKDPLERAMEMIRVHLGEKHPIMVTCLQLKAKVYTHGKLKEYDEAEKILLQALALEKETQEGDPQTIPQILYELMRVAKLGGNFAKATGYCKDGLGIARTVLPQEHDLRLAFEGIWRQFNQ